MWTFPLSAPCASAKLSLKAGRESSHSPLEARMWVSQREAALSHPSDGVTFPVEWIFLSPQNPLATCMSHLGLLSQSTPDSGLKRQTFTVSCPRGWKSKVQACAGLVSPEASLLGVGTPSPPQVLTWSASCVLQGPNLLFL